MNQTSIKHTIDSLLIATGLTAGTTGLALGVDWIPSVSDINPIEVFAAFTSYACTYLCVKQVRFNYVLGVITTAAWALFFYQANLLGSMLQNIYLVPTLIYGWFIWGRDEKTKPVKNVRTKDIPLYLGATAVTFAGAVSIIDHFGGSVPTVEAAILTGSILAQFLLDRKKIETWYVWAAINVLAIFTYFNAGAYLAALQFVIFLGNTIYGYYDWNKSKNVPMIA